MELCLRSCKAVVGRMRTGKDLNVRRREGQPCPKQGCLTGSLGLYIDRLTMVTPNVLRHQKTQNRRWWGYTLVELLLTLTIVTLLAMMAFPFYVGYLERARVARSIAEIRILEKAIDLYEFNFGDLPTNLRQVGVGVPTDPWGNPYEYVRIADAGAKY